MKVQAYLILIPLLEGALILLLLLEGEVFISHNGRLVNRGLKIRVARRRSVQTELQSTNLLQSQDNTKNTVQIRQCI